MRIHKDTQVLSVRFDHTHAGIWYPISAETWDEDDDEENGLSSQRLLDWGPMQQPLTTRQLLPVILQFLLS